MVDASTSPVQVGIPSSDNWITLHKVERHKRWRDYFLRPKKFFEDSGIQISKINRVFFCEGPGSTLGLRSCGSVCSNTALEPNSSFEVYAYNALDLASILAPQKNAIIQAPFRVGFRFVRIPNIEPLKSEKKIIPEDEALNEYPDSYHLPDLRKNDPSR